MQAVVIVPLDSLTSFLLDGFSPYAPDNVKSQISYVARLCLGPQASDATLNTLMALCSAAWKCQRELAPSYGPPVIYLDGDTTSEVLKVALLKGQFSFFEETASESEVVLPPHFFQWLRQWLDTHGSQAKTQFNAIQNG
jgi:hypothetical protein